MERKEWFLRTRYLADDKKKAVLLTVLAGSLWGTSFPAIKIGLQYMDAYTFVFLRFLVASLAMLFVLVITKNFGFNFSKKRLLLFLGVINGVAYLMQYAGMVYASASESSLFVNLSAVWVALLSPIALKERLGGRKAVGVMVSLLGVLLMTTNLNFTGFGAGELLGDLLVICAGVLWAVFIVYNKPLVRESGNMVQSMTWLLLFTMLPLLPTAPFSAATYASLPWNAWVAIFYTAILCWVVPYYLWLKGLKNITPVTSAVVLLTEIIAAVTISTVFLGEVFTVISGVGAVLIVVAILLVS
ncbi:MAG: DMT family transporter [Candidatus Bathyarchaeota archaeon]|nr:DMT family transporter [Candidatus Bathyarchaeota archaeon]